MAEVVTDAPARAGQTSLAMLAGPARHAARVLSGLTRTVKDAALLAWADAVEARASVVLEANAEDVRSAVAAGEGSAVVDRLRLDQARLREIADGLRQIASLEDPVGALLEDWKLPNGLRVKKVRVPLGVIGIIYEGRPNITVDAAGLAVKAGSAVLLRGSRIAERSNDALIRVLQDSGAKSGLPPGTVQAVPATREA